MKKRRITDSLKDRRTAKSRFLPGNSRAAVHAAPPPPVAVVDDDSPLDTSAAGLAQLAADTDALMNEKPSVAQQRATVQASRNEVQNVEFPSMGGGSQIILKNWKNKVVQLLSAHSDEIGTIAPGGPSLWQWRILVEYLQHSNSV